MGCVDHVSRNVVAATILVLVVLVLVPRHVRADGGLITNYYADVWEPAQRAILLFDPATGREDLILQAEYEGNTDNLAWIVPVPSLPTLATADAGLFVDCANLTRLVVRNRGLDCGCQGGKMTDAPGTQVDIYDNRLVGIYQTLTLGATDASVLADSLDTWGYLHAGNRPSVEAALQFYINKSWFFVAMRTDSASVAGTSPGAYRVGGLDPIHLTFSTTKAVYPLRISAISARDPSQVLLYVCAPHRMTFPGAHAEYANRINDRELRHLQSLYPLLGTVITQPCFLTKLRDSVPVSAMSDDLFLDRAPDDGEFREIRYAGIPMLEMLFVALVLAFYSGSRRFSRRRRTP
jgi:hypothetical protein